MTLSMMALSKRYSENDIQHKEAQRIDTQNNDVHQNDYKNDDSA